MVTLYNVTDTRTGKFHSEVIVKQRMVRFFVPAEEEDALGKGNDAKCMEQVMSVREEEKGGIK